MIDYKQTTKVSLGVVVMLYVALGILTMDDDDIDVGWGGIVVSLLVQVLGRNLLS